MTNELIDCWKRRKQTGVVIKLDLEKTFSWTFLEAQNGMVDKRLLLIHKFLHHHQWKVERKDLGYFGSWTREFTIPFSFHIDNGLPWLLTHLGRIRRHTKAF